LWQQLQNAKVERVFITIPVNQDTQRPSNSEALKKFIAEAFRHHIAVWAVEGEPSAILPGFRERYATQALAFSEYNKGAQPKERLQGIQYDIEPYLLPGYDLEPAEAFEAYLSALQQFRQRSSLPIEAVLPFWVSDLSLPGGEKLLTALARTVDAMTVMDYRTSQEQIVVHAKPFLNWGNAFGKPVYVALEAGQLPTEWRHIYRASVSGPLRLAQVGPYLILLLLSQKTPNMPGTGFAFSHAVENTQNQVTFHRNPKALDALLPVLNQTFSRWTSFGGVAVHGYITP
jgi:hypothetical protein